MMTDHGGPLIKNEMVPQKKSRTPMRRRRDGILVSDSGFCGPGRRRELGNYKHNLSETDFENQHSRFYQEGVDDA
jgi:hypothetical protein